MPLGDTSRDKSWMAPAVQLVVRLPYGIFLHQSGRHLQKAGARRQGSSRAGQAQKNAVHTELLGTSLEGVARMVGDKVIN